MADSVTVLDDRTSAIEDYFGQRLAGHRPVRLLAWRIASQGYSDQTIFAAFADDGGQRHNLVVRRYQSGGPLREATDPSRHYETLRALQGSGIPVPRVRWYEPDASLLGDPFFVMDEVEGFVPVPWSPEGRRFLESAGRGPIGRQFVEILARIHALDWRDGSFGFLAEPPGGRGFALGRVATLQGLIDRYKLEPEPILEDALGWMRLNAPEPAAISLVHGDYRTGNMIYGEDRIAAVLDWEFSTLGDPLLDVAWVCARSNRMDSELVSFLMPRDEFLGRYARTAGWEPSPAAVHFWEVYLQVWHTALWLSGAAQYAEGRSGDLRLARMGYTLPVMRRMVADLLNYP
jgi:aminoglycoside phosphotransferase (APT) family kinase protein